ncbi:MAG: hypothetical protein KF911_03405 [Pseudomonadales bacterium]|nr:hypothetical protein [Pseudomonadales bacterium]
MTDQRSLQGFRQVIPVLALAALLASSPGTRARAAPDGPAGAPPGASAAQCCSCRVPRAVAITNDQALPCTFDVPEGWRTEIEAGGPMGGLRFHIGFGGARYSAAASFTCPADEGWRELERLFIGTFRTNEDSEFGENTAAR